MSAATYRNHDTDAVQLHLYLRRKSNGVPGEAAGAPSSNVRWEGRPYFCAAPAATSISSEKCAALGFALMTTKPFPTAPWHALQPMMASA